VPCEEHAEQALRAVLEDVRTAYCPACGSELQEEGFEFWCTTCAGPVSRAAAEGA
jgi:Zn finger protein HypA/HybF involved in hydrogenase expression